MRWFLVGWSRKSTDQKGVRELTPWEKHLGSRNSNNKVSELGVCLENPKPARRPRWME